jgi:hypothetical protein
MEMSCGCRSHVTCWPLNEKMIDMSGCMVGLLVIKTLVTVLYVQDNYNAAK